VYVTYQTAFADDAGKPQFRADIYGLDKDANALLHGDRRIADMPMARNYNAGSKPVVASSAGRGKEMSPAATTDGWNASASYLNWRSAYQLPDRDRVW
jgi:hypothetical protein